jgi:hypothetical protein
MLIRYLSAKPSLVLVIFVEKPKPNELSSLQ